MLRLLPLSPGARDARNVISGVCRRRLLTLATIGGVFGAIYAQQSLRHKTRKEPFRTQLNVIAVLEAAALAAWAILR
jgi:uncharacterized membrane protein YsdA (DUF1294 family)